MKKHSIKNSIVIGTLCTVLSVPTFAQVANIRPISATDTEIIPISYEQKHWAEAYLDQLSLNYDVNSIFDNQDLNAAIQAEDFQYLIKLVLDEEYQNTPDTITREAIVYELMKVWADQTGKNLDQIPTIKMLIYSDANEIDATYNQAITVAYMKDIAKGKGEGIFDPKANVTYGELAVLINNTEKAIKDELSQDASPIMEGKFETRANYEIKEDQVIFDFELMSHYTEPKELMFGSGQQFEVTITDEKGEEVYKYSDGKMFTMALVMKNINPGEALKWQDQWDMTNKDGDKLTAGKYSAEIKIMVVQEENDEKIEGNQLTTVINFDLEKANQESQIIKPEAAEEIIKETSAQLINALSIKDLETISDYTHPTKGVRFTPYTYVILENDKVFNKEEIKNFLEDQETYLWGNYDGSGEDIRLTPSEYYDKFIYTKDFKNAEKIGYNEVLSSGNMLENQFEVYDNAIVVEYYFSGFDPQYSGIDWQSLRLVFEEYENDWYLVGIIHNQWTI